MFLRGALLTVLLVLLKGSLLVRLGGPDEVPGIESKSAACKTSALPTILPRQPPSFLFLDLWCTLFLFSFHFSLWTLQTLPMYSSFIFPVVLYLTCDVNVVQGAAWAS